MLHLRTFGRKDPAPDGRDSVLMLHPANYDGRIWKDVSTRLPDLTVLAVDLPGHGGSRNISLTGLEDAADRVAGTIRDIGCPPRTVVGVSLGAYVGFHLLSRHPDLMDAAVLSGFQHDPIRMNFAMKRLVEASASLTAIRPIREKMSRAMGVDDSSLSHGPDGKANASVRTVRRAMSLAFDFDARPAFETVAARTLVTAGEREHESILASLSAFENGLQNCQARVVRGVGHGWSAEAPDLFANTISAWIARTLLPDGLVLPDTVLEK